MDSPDLLNNIVFSRNSFVTFDSGNQEFVVSFLPAQPQLTDVLFRFTTRPYLPQMSQFWTHVSDLHISLLAKNGESLLDITSGIVGYLTTELDGPNTDIYRKSYTESCEDWLLYLEKFEHPWFDIDEQKEIVKYLTSVAKLSELLTPIGGIFSTKSETPDGWITKLGELLIPKGNSGGLEGKNSINDWIHLYSISNFFYQKITIPSISLRDVIQRSNGNLQSILPSVSSICFSVGPRHDYSNRPANGITGSLLIELECYYTNQLANEMDKFNKLATQKLLQIKNLARFSQNMIADANSSIDKAENLLKDVNIEAEEQTKRLGAVEKTVDSINQKLP